MTFPSFIHPSCVPSMTRATAFRHLAPPMGSLNSFTWELSCPPKISIVLSWITTLLESLGKSQGEHHWGFPPLGKRERKSWENDVKSWENDMKSWFSGSLNWLVINRKYICFLVGKSSSSKSKLMKCWGGPPELSWIRLLKMWGKSGSLCDSDLLEKTFQNLSHFAKHWLGTSSEKLVSLGLEVGARSPLSDAGSRSL